MQMPTPSKVFQILDNKLLLHIFDASDGLFSLDDPERDSADIGYLQNADVLDSDTDQTSNSVSNDDNLLWTVTAKYEADFHLLATQAYK